MEQRLRPNYKSFLAKPKKVPRVGIKICCFLLGGNNKGTKSSFVTFHESSIAHTFLGESLPFLCEVESLLRGDITFLLGRVVKKVSLVGHSWSLERRTGEKEAEKNTTKQRKGLE